MAKKKRMADCHPDRPYCAKGLCQQCYDFERREQKHEYYMENRERILMQTSKWKEENKEYLVTTNRRYREENTEACRERNREWDEQNPDYKREYHLRRKYGITLADYDKMLEDQGNACAICGTTPEENGKRLYVDHNHETGKIRGLLCHSCNVMLGQAQDDISILSEAITYLNDHAY